MNKTIEQRIGDLFEECNQGSKDANFEHAATRVKYQIAALYEYIQSNGALSV